MTVPLRQLRDRHWHLMAAGAAFCILGLVACRGALHEWSRAPIGDGLDGWQGVWGLWWWRYCGEFGNLPMRSDALWWPHGVPLWFQTWNIPVAVLALPLWGWFSGPAIYNSFIVFTFPASALAMCALCLEIWPDEQLAAIVAGGIYSFSTFHFAHAQANLHLASLEWPVLALLWGRRALRQPTFRVAAIGGGILGFASLASPYFGLWCIVALLVLVTFPGEVVAVGTPRAVGRLASATIGCLAVAGWLVLGMYQAQRHSEYVGAHPSDVFSADVQSFFWPNAVSELGSHVQTWRKWTVRPAETSSYIGYVVLALAGLGAITSRCARPYCAVAVVGGILALGPTLHVAGRKVGVSLPEGVIEDLSSVLRFSGMPSRFSWLVTFGLSVTACAGLQRIRGWTGRLGVFAVVLLGAASVWEHWPVNVTPAIADSVPLFEQWAKSPQDWSVLDASAGSRPLEHQMVHHKRILAGYVTRTPRALADELRSDPLLGPFFPPPIGRGEPSRADPVAVINQLKSLSVKYVVIDSSRATIAARLQLRLVYSGELTAVYAVD